MDTVGVFQLNFLVRQEVNYDVSPNFDKDKSTVIAKNDVAKSNPPSTGVIHRERIRANDNPYD